MPTTPCFAATYAALNGEPIRPWTLAMLTMRPRPRASRCGQAAFEVWKTLSRSTARTFAYLSSGKSAIGETNCTPALFTTWSRAPRSRAAASTVARIALGSRTSQAYERAVTPCAAAISRAVLAAVSASTSTSARAEPACASASAQARPMPRAPPVTKLTRSWRSIESKGSSSSSRRNRSVGTLVLSNVARSFGNVTAVRDVSFTVPPGTTFGLLGPNGAGKTTTMRMILGILLPDGGSVTWDGKAVDLSVRRRFGYLPEERGLYGKLKVREQIAYFGRLLGVDEPFSGLDPVNAETLLEALRALKQAGTTLILSSHQMWQIEDLCESFCVIAGGTVRARGTLEELRASWPTRIVEIEPVDDALRGVLDALPGARRLPEADRPALAYEIPADADTAALLRRLVGAGNVTRFERVDPSLRDIYLRAIGAAA